MATTKMTAQEFFDDYVTPILKNTFGKRKERSGWLMRQDCNGKVITVSFLAHDHDAGRERAITLTMVLTSQILTLGIDCQIKREGNTVTLTF